MAILLDTQIFIWLEENPEHISYNLREAIYAESIVFLSSVSVWEMAIKIKTGKLKFKLPLHTTVTNFIKDYRFRLLDIRLDHIYKTKELDLHHRDPFDRLLIAQAIVENVALISSDEAFDAYGIQRIWKL